ncbi:cytochrome c1 [Sphingomonas spermidinifaciens]|uniref:Cytochrome c1 n=1 Tax=Sphingomonas spermidinifaciens TaxID=1141889 RepID=A0A2A4B2U0_9SPHN|nr:cytochrome c1 [Sphingomonas spermidinifaciens]PCD02004.1 cytochrome c1 [Sphingomonas spermidinifaciens]
MTRIIAPLIGLGFAFVLVLGLFGTITTASEPATAEHEFHLKPKPVALASNGIFGKFDRQQLQRGFQVYKEVCAACHSISLVAFRDLAALGYSEAEVKAIANQWTTEQPSVNPETGEAATRKNLPSDKFPHVYPNEVAARAANNNAIPPDLSLMTKARPDGAAYVHSLLTGYQQPSAELMKEFPNFATPEGLYFNPYFPTLNLAMPQPLVSDGQVTYADGTNATVDQMAKDVTAFLVWTAEPKLEARHTAGLASVVFLIIFIALTIGAYKSVWRNVKH